MRKMSILAMLVGFISIFALGSSFGQVAGDRVEEIYVVRSMLESRGAQLSSAEKIGPAWAKPKSKTNTRSDRQLFVAPTA